MLWKGLLQSFYILFFGNVGNAVFAEEKSGSLGCNPEAETILVVISDISLQPFSVGENDRHFSVRIDKRSEVFVFSACRFWIYWRMMMMIAGRPSGMIGESRSSLKMSP